MASTRNTILSKMLDRLFAGLSSGPNLNCRPHSSRQRVDWTQFARLQDIDPRDALCQLLSDGQSVKLTARVAPPPPSDKAATGKRPVVDTSAATEAEPDEAPSPDQKKRDDWTAQQALLTRLRSLAEDARDYEQDTGVHVLHVGFPLLSLPPQAAGAWKSMAGGAKRLLAPIAFIPVTLEMRAGPKPVAVIDGLRDGADFLVPNEALFAWLERQTGQRILPDPLVTAEKLSPTDEASSGEETASSDRSRSPDVATPTAPETWRELNELVGLVAKALQISPVTFGPQTLSELRSAPRTDDSDPRAEIVPAAVLGLFPMNNQNLLRDMQSMAAEPDSLQGPVQSFINATSLVMELAESSAVEAESSAKPDATQVEPTPATTKDRDCYLITIADPCQSQAVRLASDCQGLVIHGPPGTGKSQTITNIIGDHLSRGERVLLVCDKRTALDVVARRLEHLGLGSLCAVIHDPQHDQRNLYMQVREQLEQLTSTPIGNRSETQLKALDRQLEASRSLLSKAWSLTMSPDPVRGVSFHDRMGEWLESTLPALSSGRSRNSTRSTTVADPSRRRRRNTQDTPPEFDPNSVDQFNLQKSAIRDLIERAARVDLANNPWATCCGMPLATFLSRSAANIRDDIKAVVQAAEEVDQSGVDPAIRLLTPQHLAASESSPTGFPQQAAAREHLAGLLKQCLDNIDPAWRKQWAAASLETIRTVGERLSGESSLRDAIRSTPLDSRLWLIHRERNASTAQVASDIGCLAAYDQICGKWYYWLAFRTREQARVILQAYGLPPNRESAAQLHRFLSSIADRSLAAALLKEVMPDTFGSLTPDNTALPESWDRLELLLKLLRECHQNVALSGLAPAIQNCLTEGDNGLIDALQDSAQRSTSLQVLLNELQESGLFNAAWLSESFDRLCRGESICADLQQLVDRLDSLGEVLRIQSILAGFPDSIRRIVEYVISTGTGGEAALTEIRRQILSDDIEHWLTSTPELQGIDGVRLSKVPHEIRELEDRKQACVRDRIRDRWVGRQRERLLASTGTRLSSMGADLRRRLTTRGERAMGLRQVVAIGDRIEGGDPLFDLRPVWMASPETVAQIFPREPFFDVVIFDEASQCRLEEALPVLTRAKRVVIAGDPKQLPPTRFFESAVITSGTSDAETDQELFEAHQSNVEDLLSAALSLDIQECYLDVHYRSRNADLVEFSNQQFYGSRLQAIPGHPKNRIRFAPITLYRAAGIYENRTNAAEASQVVKIVADLLRRSEPPSIGIACFNLTQRDLILDSLAELAAQDADFATRLATARHRIGAGAFEGLFVKNLENVQGDERDHMIISTTYGPDSQGRFYRRFGPLGQAGGGRRLNVLVTRAREEVHLVTSIPESLYRDLPPVPDGKVPGGGWLLFAYLSYAEELSRNYTEWRQSNESSAEAIPIRVVERPSRTPSLFASQIAQAIAGLHRIGCDIHWGNDGFCVDVAFHHPKFAEDRTLGLLVDGTRYQFADDPVAWDVFRTAILEGQGWQLYRCWTPEFFRDPEGSLRRFVAEADRIANEEPDPDGIPVEEEP
jgi:hypothetical protein